MAWALRCNGGGSANVKAGLGLARRGLAGHGKVWFGWAVFGRVRFGEAGTLLSWWHCESSRFGGARFGSARRGVARQGMAWPGWAWFGEAGTLLELVAVSVNSSLAGCGWVWHGGVWLGRARPGTARQGFFQT
jgi:hypothetical protein